MEPRRHDGATIHDKTRTKRGVRSVPFSLYHITVNDSSKKKTRQECSAGVSGSSIYLKETKICQESRAGLGTIIRQQYCGSLTSFRNANEEEAC